MFGFRSSQFDEAVALVKAVRLVVGSNLVVSGHSMGGAEAAVGGLEANVHAVTFNAEGISSGTINRYGLNMSIAKSLITNYHTIFDPLTIGQNILPFVPEAAGRQVTLPGIHFHSISGVCSALNTQC